MPTKNGKHWLTKSETYKNLYSFICFLVLPIALANGQIDDKTLKYNNYVYEDLIRTVIFYPEKGLEHDMINPPVIPLNQPNKLVLEFDELTDQISYFNVKIIHCNADWTKSDMYEMDYLRDYNEFNINQYQSSFNTRVPYTHYKFEVPPVLLSGNYLLVVYRDYNQEDIVITQRFSVFENRVTVKPNLTLSSIVSVRQSHQQVNFSIHHQGLDVNNPLETIYVVIRKNQRWDNAKFGIRPTFVQQNQQRLDFNHTSMDVNFPGGNEYRKFDARSTKFSGFHVERVVLNPDFIDVYIEDDEPLPGHTYIDAFDINGQYYIDHYEYGTGATESDYLMTHFNLSVPQELDGEVYAFGAFSNWLPLKRYKLTYDAQKRRYEGSGFMKQGYYNYKYIFIPEGKPIDEYYFSGSFHETENMYEIFVYHKPLGRREQYLVGYEIMYFNNRN